MANVLNGVRNIAENFNRLSTAHERYRRLSDMNTIAYSETKTVLTKSPILAKIKFDKVECLGFVSSCSRVSWYRLRIMNIRAREYIV